MLDTREKLLDIREKLAGRLLVGDGAVDTLLADRGVDQPYYKANLTHTQIVRDVHKEYLRAGARVIETNAFLANRLKLGRGKASRRRSLPHVAGVDAPSSRGCNRTNRPRKLRAEVQKGSWRNFR